MKNIDLETAISQVGGASAAARIIGKSAMTVSKWRKRGALPKTEYTGETSYAEALAAASDGQFTAEWLREIASPSRVLLPALTPAHPNKAA